MTRNLEIPLRIVFATLFIPSMTGVIRFYTGLDLTLSLIFSGFSLFLYFVLEAFASRRFEIAGSRNDGEDSLKLIGPFISIGILVVAALVLKIKLASPSFFDLPIVGTEGGGDAGNHVMLSESFKLKNPREYEGQNLFYVLVSLILEPASRNFHAAFWKSTYFLWFISYSSTLMMFYGIVKKLQDWRALLSAGIFALAVVVVLSNRIIFPYYHYFQIDGFFSSLAGLAVLFLMWASYATIRTWVGRVFAVLVGVVLLRHAYALNVGEFLLTASFICFLESTKKRHWMTIILKCFSVLLVLGAVFVYWKLFPLLEMGGGFTHWRPHNGFPLLLIFLLVASIELKRSQISKDSSEDAYKRFLAFGVIFGSSGLLVQLLVFFSGITLRYYFYKHALPLFLFASVGLVGILLRKLSLRLSGDVRIEMLPLGRWVKVALVLGIFVAWTTARIYYVTLPVRRMDCRDGCHELSPLHFPFIQDDIQHVLKVKEKKFGGILHTHWPFFNFLTASLGRHVALWNEQPSYFSGDLMRSKGYCVFWSETPRERERMIGFTKDKTYTDLKKARLAIYESLVASPIKECGSETGQGYWRNVLCWECR